MDSQKLHSLRRFGIRILGTLAGVVFLYFAGIGPAWCVLRFTQHSEAFIETLYRPLWQAAEKTPMERPLDAYVTWRVDLWQRYDKRTPTQTKGPIGETPR